MMHELNYIALTPQLKIDTPLVDAYCPAIIARLYRPIYRQAARLSGMKTEEVEASPEFWGALISTIVPVVTSLAGDLF